jgi:hypothetical protein
LIQKAHAQSVDESAAKSTYTLYQHEVVTGKTSATPRVSIQIVMARWTDGSYVHQTTALSTGATTRDILNVSEQTSRKVLDEVAAVSTKHLSDAAVKHLALEAPRNPANNCLQPSDSNSTESLTGTGILKGVSVVYVKEVRPSGRDEGDYTYNRTLAPSLACAELETNIKWGSSPTADTTQRVLDSISLDSPVASLLTVSPYYTEMLPSEADKLRMKRIQTTVAPKTPEFQTPQVQLKLTDTAINARAAAMKKTDASYMAHQSQQK